MQWLAKIRLVTLSLILGVPLLAQQPPPDRDRISMMGDMEARRERLEALRIYKMTEFLNLTEDQAANFYPRLNAFENGIREKQKQQMKIIREIDRKVADGNFKTSEAEVKKYSRQLADAERDMIQEKEKFINELGDILTPEQQMRYLIFEARFRQRLIRSLEIKHEQQQIKRR